MFSWLVRLPLNILSFTTALAKAQQLLLDPQERDYILNQVSAAKGVQIISNLILLSLYRKD